MEALRPVTVLDAALQLGKSADAVRGLIRRGKLRSSRGNDGTIRVLMPPANGSLPPVATVGRTTVAEGRNDSLQAELAEVRAELLQATERAARAEGRAEALAVAIASLQDEVGWLRQPWWTRLFGR